MSSGFEEFVLCRLALRTMYDAVVGGACDLQAGVTLAAICEGVFAACCIFHVTVGCGTSAQLKASAPQAPHESNVAVLLQEWK